MTISACQRHTACSSTTPDASMRVRKFLQVLEHTSSCQRQNCATQCTRMKTAIRHFILCGHCQICKQFFSAVYFHAKSCKDNHCKVYFCSPTKRKINRLLESEEEH
ncbi:hypothetical protein M3Y97_00104200 [Aphelenchoides bicaudatus]|nr:hypothetical protein M3Y97_00104200 [Aphelenchoides bicaudatus]